MLFKYKDKVRVIKGFYEGQEGEIVNLDAKLILCYGFYKYGIKIGADEFIYVNESDLEKVEERE